MEEYKESREPLVNPASQLSDAELAKDLHTANINWNCKTATLLSQEYNKRHPDEDEKKCFGCTEGKFVKIEDKKESELRAAIIEPSPVPLPTSLVPKVKALRPKQIIIPPQPRPLEKSPFILRQFKNSPNSQAAPTSAVPVAATPLAPAAPAPKPPVNEEIKETKLDLKKGSVPQVKKASCCSLM